MRFRLVSQPHCLHHNPRVNPHVSLPRNLVQLRPSSRLSSRPHGPLPGQAHNRAAGQRYSPPSGRPSNRAPNRAQRRRGNRPCNQSHNRAGDLLLNPALGQLWNHQCSQRAGRLVSRQGVQAHSRARNPPHVQAASPPCSRAVNRHVSPLLSQVARRRCNRRLSRPRGRAACPVVVPVASLAVNRVSGLAASPPVSRARDHRQSPQLSLRASHRHNPLSSRRTAPPQGHHRSAPASGRAPITAALCSRSCHSSAAACGLVVVEQTRHENLRRALLWPLRQGSRLHSILFRGTTSSLCKSHKTARMSW